jgi:hypothetical protein
MEQPDSSDKRGVDTAPSSSPFDALLLEKITPSSCKRGSALIFADILFVLTTESADEHLLTNIC